MRSLFKTRPDHISIDYSASHVDKGEGYKERFSTLKGRAAMWGLEKEAIERLVGGMRPARVLDFAAGTGRISGVLREMFPKAEITGIDISESMLSVAKSAVPGVTFRQMDGRGALDFFGASSMDLVTAFRFFPNADLPLREAVADQIAELIKPGGTVFINNHRNFWSLSYLMNRARPGAEAPGALNGDIVDLFVARGFRLEEKISLGVWPQTEGRAAILPWSFVKRFERANLKYFSRAHGLGYNMLYRFVRN